MKRLTPTDWDTINAALALYETEVEDSDDASEMRRVAQVRDKVWERREEHARQRDRIVT